MQLARFAGLGGAMVAGLLAGWPSGASAAPAATELLYERTLMGEANLRCHLFTPPVAAALAASAAQARGAAIRAGASPQVVAGAEARAKARADTTPCGLKDLATAADRVRTAFQDYARLTSMTFPGAFADWRAVKASRAPLRAPAWRLVQFASAGVRPTLFGLSAGINGAGPDPAVTVVRPGPSALSAITARLVVRNPARDAEPYLDPRRKDLASRLPPRGLDQVILAQARMAAPRSLLPPEAPVGAAFLFPQAAAEAVARLDPRDAVAVEFVYGAPSGERVETAWFEAGDFAAARAFLAVPTPPPIRPK